jgi:ADP-ribose pyrophosphatase YjhB (NUDIX family)
VISTTLITKLNYCYNCGSKLDRSVPKGDTLERSICSKCELIHYENPKILVASIIEHDEKILLCKRAIKPRLGFWTLPSGYMECNETILEAARRETQEETNILVKKLHLYVIFSCPDINQVYFIFRGNVQDSGLCPCPTEESSESRYFSKGDIPWSNLSYSIIDKALYWYFYDKKLGKYKFRMLDVYGCDPDTNE